jgi:hypothetical protein
MPVLTIAADEDHIKRVGEFEKKLQDDFSALCALLMSVRYAIHSGNPADLAKFLTTDSVSTVNLFSTHSLREMYVGACGLTLFLFTACYDCLSNYGVQGGIKSALMRRLPPKNIRLFITFLFATVGGALLFSQRHTAAGQRNWAILAPGYLFLAFSGYASSSGNEDKLIQSLRESLSSQPIDVTETPVSNKKTKLKSFLVMVVSFRNAMLAGGGSDLIAASSSDTTNVNGVLLNYAVLELFYGTAVILLIFISLFYDICSGRVTKSGFLKVFDGHFSADNLKLSISAGMSITASILLFYESAKNVKEKSQTVAELVRLLLYTSGALTGSKIQDLLKYFLQLGGNLSQQSSSESDAPQAAAVDSSPNEPIATPASEMRSAPVLVNTPLPRLFVSAETMTSPHLIEDEPVNAFDHAVAQSPKIDPYAPTAAPVVPRLTGTHPS